MKLNDSLDRFLEDQALQSALRAALQRNRLYRDEDEIKKICGTNNTKFKRSHLHKTKKEFGTKWKNALRQTGAKYLAGNIEFSKYSDDLLGILNIMQSYISGSPPTEQS